MLRRRPRLLAAFMNGMSDEEHPVPTEGLRTVPPPRLPGSAIRRPRQRLIKLCRKRTEAKAAK